MGALNRGLVDGDEEKRRRVKGWETRGDEGRGEPSLRNLGRHRGIQFSPLRSDDAHMTRLMIR